MFWKQGLAESIAKLIIEICDILSDYCVYLLIISQGKANDKINPKIQMAYQLVLVTGFFASLGIVAKNIFILVYSLHVKTNLDNKDRQLELFDLLTSLLALVFEDIPFIVLDSLVVSSLENNKQLILLNIIVSSISLGIKMLESVKTLIGVCVIPGTILDCCNLKSMSSRSQIIHHWRLLFCLTTNHWKPKKICQFLWNTCLFFAVGFILFALASDLLHATCYFVSCSILLSFTIIVLFCVCFVRCILLCMNTECDETIQPLFYHKNPKYRTSVIEETKIVVI